MDRRGEGWIFFAATVLGTAGVVAGAIACITAVWWMPYYPIWSLAYIAIGVLVIYALAAYGGQPEAT